MGLHSDLPDNSSPGVSLLAPTEGSKAPSTPPSERKGCVRATQKARGTSDGPLAVCGGSGALPANLAETQRPKLALVGSTNAIEPLAQYEKCPWRNKSTPPGPRGLHPAGALVCTHRGLEYETPSRQELPRAKSRQSLRESAHTLPEAWGLLSGTIKRGPLSKNQKIA